MAAYSGAVHVSRDHAKAQTLLGPRAHGTECRDRWMAQVRADPICAGPREGCMMQAAEIHARLGSNWPAVLAQLGIPETALRNKHGPCPACGGKDRYRFDNKRGRGDY